MLAAERLPASTTSALCPPRPTPQLNGLSELHTLVLSVHCSPGGYGALERLPRLRRLQCSSCMHLPASLSRLTGLEELMLYSVDNAASLDRALQALTRLTSLCAACWPRVGALRRAGMHVGAGLHHASDALHLPVLHLRSSNALRPPPHDRRAHLRSKLRRALFNMQPPPAVAGLARLQRACFTYSYGDPPGGYAALPAGPWAASLRQLCTSYDTSLLSRQLLEAAGQLEQLGVAGRDFAGAVGREFPAATLSAASASGAGAGSTRRCSSCTLRW